MRKSQGMTELPWDTAKMTHFQTVSMSSSMLILSAQILTMQIKACMLIKGLLVLLEKQGEWTQGALFQIWGYSGNPYPSTALGAMKPFVLPRGGPSLWELVKY